MSEASNVDQIRQYYGKKESRWGYRLLLGGTRHFGYYPSDSKRISMRAAQRNMNEEVAKSLSLPVGSRVLDAGCGEGSVALHLAGAHGLHVDGIDLVDESIAKAQRKLANHKFTGAATFQIMDYSNLLFDSELFDGVYTMETLVHSPDHRRTLSELRRVLKPAGSLVLFEYSVPDLAELDETAKRDLYAICKGSAMNSLPSFVTGQFPMILRENGFEDVSVFDISEKVEPMLKRLTQLGAGPFWLARCFGGEKRFVNIHAAAVGYKYRNLFRYNIVTAKRAD